MGPRFYATSVLVLAACSCSGGPEPVLDRAEPTSCAFALAPHEGVDPIDDEIRDRQSSIRGGGDPVAQLERLGWAYVAKARQSFDVGYYGLAEQAARCVEAFGGTETPGALLLRGHVLHQRHEFREAETVARRLVEERGLAFDEGLLGDVLLEQGKLDEAGAAYQRMMDRKPSPQAYARGAQLRWLTGDLDGALELQTLAARTAGASDTEAAAWQWVRLALFELQGGDGSAASRSLASALALVPDYPPALLTQGKVLLAAGDADGALDPLGRARDANPLPEYEWALLEALEAAHRGTQAASASERLLETGPLEDPRTLAVFLATRHREASARAVALAEAELDVRRDAFTLDALSWSRFANGDVEEARALSERARSEGVEDARLDFHGAAIAAAVGNIGEARRLLKRAERARALLLPSERSELERLHRGLSKAATHPSTKGEES